MEQDGRCSLTIDDIEILVDVDEEANALHCYVDLGDPNPHERMEVCEQLLALNLHTHLNHHGTYAFEPTTARAIFCANVLNAANLNGDELAEILRYYVDETESARQIISSTSSKSLGALFTATLA